MVGYLGPIHSFTYQAASTFYMQGELLPYGNFHLLFEALDKDLVEGIVVPIENSIEGTVNVVQDKLLEYGFQINREIVMDIRLSLISKSNQLETIKYVISNPVALQQCRNTLSKELGKYKEVYEDSTSKAVKNLFELDETYAAVASEENVLGELNILLNDCQDYQQNQTRFLFIKKTLEVIGLHNKTSIVITPQVEVSGALYDILHEFAIRSINLTKIESRPSKEELGSYKFYIDFEGNIEDQVVKDAIAILTHKSKSIKLLGSYYSKK
jgi:prephenate dehydratase